MSQQLQKGGNTELKEFSNYLNRLKPQMALALPKHMNADRMTRLALTAFSTTPKLQKCSPNSIAASIMTAGQLGLEPGVNGAGYLIPYGTTCTFVPGWKGLVDLVARSGRGTVYTGVIFKDQDYTFTDGARRDLVVHNETDLVNPLDITHAFAVGWVKDASMPIIELWGAQKITKHRDKYNKVGKSHYSFRDWEMYCRKVPLLQVLKYMPASIELANALDVANASEMGHGVTIENGIVIDLEAEIEAQQQEQAQQNSIPECTPDQFEKELPGWLKLIEEKKKTAEQIISMTATRFTLSDAQKARLTDKPETAKEADEGGAAPSYAEVANYIQNATSSDKLNVAIEMIGEIADEQQRKELLEVCDARKLQITSGEV